MLGRRTARAGRLPGLAAQDQDTVCANTAITSNINSNPDSSWLHPANRIAGRHARHREPAPLILALNRVTPWAATFTANCI